MGSLGCILRHWERPAHAASGDEGLPPGPPVVMMQGGEAVLEEILPHVELELRRAKDGLVLLSLQTIPRGRASLLVSVVDWTVRVHTK